MEETSSLLPYGQRPLEQAGGGVVRPDRSVVRPRLVPIRGHAHHSPLGVVGEANRVRPAALVGLSTLEIVLVNRGFAKEGL